MDRTPEFADPRLLQAAVHQAFNAVLVTDANFSDGGPLIEFCNPAFCHMTGYQAAELIGRSPRLLQGPRTDPAVIDELRDCLREGRYFQGSTVNYRKDGTPYHVEWNISQVRNADGDITHFVSVQRNISARIEAERTRDLLAEALNVSSDPILITDDQARICFANRSFQTVTGFTLAETMGSTPKFLQSGSHDDAFYAKLRDCLEQGQSFRATFRNLRKDGSHYFADQSITPIRGQQDDEISHYVSISKDITEAIEHGQALCEKARRDGLTGLLNRDSGDELLAQQLRAAAQTLTPISVLLGDIDHFKQVNDAFGHLVGDRVLKAVASIVQGSVRDTDHAIRWGGEEFLIILPKAPPQGAERLAERIRRRLADWHDDEIGSVTLSWGATAWRPGESADRLLGRADGLLYAAKRHGRNRIESDLVNASTEAASVSDIRTDAD